MRTSLVITLCAGLLMACSTTSTQEEEKKKKTKTAFEQFVDSIPQIGLPFELSTEKEIDHVDMESPFIPEGAALIGKLKPHEGRYLILYSYPADIRLPILEVYDPNGDKLNELPLFDFASCPLESGGHSRLEILNDHEIIKETVCDAYDSRIDRDTIPIEGLLKKE